MGWIERKIKSALGRQVDIVHDNPNDNYSIKSIGNILIPEKLTDENAFLLCNSVSELFFVVDFYADRLSKLRYYIADKNNKEVENTELNRFITSINPLYTFNDLIYQYIFSYMGDGNAISYLKAPDTLGKKSVNNITRLDILHPDKTVITEEFRMSTLNITDIRDVIRTVQYTEGIGIDYLKKENICIDNYSLNKRENSIILSKSPFFSANKSIDTLLSVYSARYNVYANNGYAGYLARKTSNTNSSLEGVLNDSTTRDSILKDINNRAGLTGKRNLWGISSVPLEFINTLISIDALKPFDETLEDSIKIASCFQIPPELVPRKDQSTFNNKETSERSVWENGLLSMLNTVCNNFTKNLMLDTVGYKIMADTSNVSALKLNETTLEEINTKKLANLEKIKTINPSKENEVNAEIDKIILGYGKR